MPMRVQFEQDSAGRAMANPAAVAAERDSAASPDLPFGPPSRACSIAALARARRSVAGGDSSTMRVLPYHPPIVAERGEGPYVFDLDGNRYIDLNMAYGPLLFGHRPDFLVRRLVAQLTERGSQLGFPTELTFRVA